MPIRQCHLRDELIRLMEDLRITDDCLRAVRLLYLFRAANISGMPIRRSMEIIHENLPTIWFTVSEMEEEIILRNPGHGKKSLTACIKLGYKQLWEVDIVEKQGDKKLSSYRLKQKDDDFSI